MDISTHLKNISSYTKHAELYHYEDYDMSDENRELTVPSPFEIFVSDIYFSKLNLPDTLLALDLWFDHTVHFEFNMPPKIEEIVLINANIKNKNLMELFPDNVRYSYSECLLDGTPLSIVLYKLYNKYFSDKATVSDMINGINYRYHKTFINKIKEYEARIAQGKAFRLAIKEELVAAVWHPDKVEKLINEYGIDILDTL
jgi:hypothetical protein